MSVHIFEVALWVDDEALEEHDGDSIAPPNEVEDWDVSDIADAMKLGIVVPHESTVEFYNGLKGE